MAGNCFIYVNGEFLRQQEVAISPYDRGFLLSDGLFETMRAYRGKVFQLKNHCLRLKSGCIFLKIPFSFSEQTIEDICQELLQRNKLLKQDAVLRLTVTRGPGPRGLSPPQKSSPTILLTASPLSPEPLQSANVLVVTLFKKNDSSPLTQFKCLNYLENICAKMEATEKGFSDALLLNSKNYVVGASAANIFIVNSEHQLLTPYIADGALPGITRQTVLELAQDLGISCMEKSLTLEDLQQAQEVFLTNSVIEIQPVYQINDNFRFDINQNHVTRGLIKKYQLST